MSTLDSNDYFNDDVDLNVIPSTPQVNPTQDVNEQDVNEEEEDTTKSGYDYKVNVDCYIPNNSNETFECYYNLFKDYCAAVQDLKNEKDVVIRKQIRNVINEMIQFHQNNVLDQEWMSVLFEMMKNAGEEQSILCLVVSAATCAGLEKRKLLPVTSADVVEVISTFLCYCHTIKALETSQLT
nr:uncharacterized protein LOC124810761 [Hydra vulgaris]